MNLEKFKVECGNKKHFIKKFKALMGVEVNNIICIETLMSHVEPVGELPVGFVLMESSKFYLVGWTDSKKRCNPCNLYPHRKLKAKLYGLWTKREWTFTELYGCVFQRIRQLEDPPTVIDSVGNWENNRQALFSCAKCIGSEMVNKIKCYELKALDSIIKDNVELFNSVCDELSLPRSPDQLKRHVSSMYEKEISFINEENFKASGILNLIKDATSKWNI